MVHYHGELRWSHDNQSRYHVIYVTLIATVFQGIWLPECVSDGWGDVTEFLSTVFLRFIVSSKKRQIVSALVILKDNKNVKEDNSSLKFYANLSLRRFDSFETKSLDLRNTFCRYYLVNTRLIEAIFRWGYHSK